MSTTDGLTRAEHAATELVQRLIATGHLGPLVESLRDGAHGHEDAREALRLLVELDPERLVQLALDSVVSQV